jgi:hypothetical protein
VTISTWNNRGVYFFGPFNHFPTRLKILPHNFPGYYAQTPLIIVFTAFLSKNEFISAKFIEKCGGKMANIQYSFTKLENVEYLNNQNSYLKEYIHLWNKYGFLKFHSNSICDRIEAIPSFNNKNVLQLILLKNGKTNQSSISFHKISNCFYVFLHTSGIYTLCRDPKNEKNEIKTQQYVCKCCVEDYEPKRK